MRILQIVAAFALSVGTIAHGQLALPADGIIDTIAGNGTAGSSGNGGPATTAELNQPGGMTVDSAGNLFIADSSNNVIRKVAAATGIISTVAGGGSAACVAGTPNCGGSYSGDGGPATSASLNEPLSVAVDGSGNLYIADYGNSVIRKVTAATGIISTVAGNGFSGFSGDGGAATSAQLFNPYSVAVDSAGNLYIADLANYRVRKVTVSTGIISTAAGTGSRGVPVNGALATASELQLPGGVAVDTSGNLYISDYGNEQVYKVDAAAGTITIVAGIGFFGYSGDGGAATAAQLYWPLQIALDASANLYIADSRNNCIRKVAVATGIITTLAGDATPGFSGDGGAATSATLNDPYGVAVDASGNVYIGDYGNNRVRAVGSGVTTPVPSYTVSVTASSLTPQVDQSVTLTATILDNNQQPVGSGNVSWVSGTTSLGQSTVGTNGVATLTTNFAQPGTITVNANFTPANSVGDTTGTVSLNVMVLALTGPSDPNVSIPAGQSAQASLSLSAFSGFTGTVSLSCSGMPSPGSCSLSPSTVNFATSTGNQTVALTVQTSAASTASLGTSSLARGLILATLCPVFILVGGRRSRGRIFLLLLMCAAAATLTLATVGCSPSPAPSTTTQTPTPTVAAGTYTVTVTAQSGSNSASIPIAVTVQ